MVVDFAHHSLGELLLDQVEQESSLDGSNGHVRAATQDTYREREIYLITVNEGRLAKTFEHYNATLTDFMARQHENYKQSYTFRARSVQ